MKKELELKLVEKYPKIFCNYGGDKKETCMHWGFEHGDGWYNLLDVLCGNIQSHIDFMGVLPQVVTTQVKEKFGGLRFYINGGDDYISGMISMTESMSYYICEKCGSTDDVAQTRGWINTLCKKCMKERELNKEKENV